MEPIPQAIQAAMHLASDWKVKPMTTILAFLLIWPIFCGVLVAGINHFWGAQ